MRDMFDPVEGPDTDKTVVLSTSELELILQALDMLQSEATDSRLISECLILSRRITNLFMG